VISFYYIVEEPLELMIVEIGNYNYNNN